MRVLEATFRGARMPAFRFIPNPGTDFFCYVMSGISVRPHEAKSAVGKITVQGQPQKA